MNLELESFLDEAFKPVQPLWKDVGRVVVDPDYEAEETEEDSPKLAAELTKFLREQTPNPDGQEISIPNGYPLLKKYLRSVSLHPEHLDDCWVEVVPPGNWI